jgi:hypothetical protein
VTLVQIAISLQVSYFANPNLHCFHVHNYLGDFLHFTMPPQESCMLLVFVNVLELGEDRIHL